jgi:hypothetical protein
VTIHPGRVREAHHEALSAGAFHVPYGRVPANTHRAVAVAFAVLCLAGAAMAADPAPPAQSEPARADAWQKLFDGKELGQWKVIDEFDFKHHGKVHVADGAIVMERGDPAAGVKWSGPFPKDNYEITLEGKRVEGDDFFSSMTFPVGDKALTLVVGGWGGQIVGLSSINDEPAVENETCQYKEFERDRWYRVRLRVTSAKIEAWIDDEKLVDLDREGRKFTLYWEMEPMLPFGIATWRTTGVVRDIRLRRLKAESGKQTIDVPIPPAAAGGLDALNPEP